MTLKTKNKEEESKPIPMPFNEALKRVWSAPPAHKVAKKQEKKKPG